MRCGALVAVLLTVGLSLVGQPAVGNPGTRADAAVAVPTAAPTAVDDLGACMASRHRASVLLLLDQSGSLRDTDPDGTRVPAARYLVQRLAALSARGIAVRVSVGGFAAGATTSPFELLDSHGTGTVLDRVSQVGSVDNGFETDYWSALDTASSALRAEQRDQTVDATPPCSAVVLFTDGKYDLGVRSTDTQKSTYGLTKTYAPEDALTSVGRAADAVRLGVASICRTGGVVDQMRASGIRLFALGLGSPTGDTDFSTLQRIATGRAPGAAPCGKLTDPAGDFRPASDVDSLLFGFDALGDPTNPALDPVQTTVCPRTICRASHVSFELDGSIRRIHLLGSADLDGYTAYLTTPGGTAPTALTRRDTPLDFHRGSVTGRVTWLSDRTFALDAAIPVDGTGWTGTWSLAFVDPTGTHPDAVARTQLTIYGDLAPVLSGAASPAIRLGERHPLAWTVQRADGSAVNPDQLPRRTSLDVDLVRDGGASTSLARGLRPVGGRFTAIATIDPTQGVTGAKLRTTLHVTTNGGTHLVDTVRESAVTLTPPASYPSVSTSVDFPTTDGTAAVTGGVAVRGPGCVWLDAAATSTTGQPDGITATTVTSPNRDRGSCLALLKDQRATLPMTLAVTGRGAGASTEQLTVLGLPSTGTRPARYVVAAQAPVIRSVDSGRRLGALVGALVLGIGIPVLLWLLIRYRGARFATDRLQVADVPVTIDGTGRVLRNDGGALLAVGDLTPVPVTGRRARTLLAGPARFRSRMGRSPVSAGTGVVSVPGELVGSAVAGHVDRRGRARTGLALREVWVLHAPPGVWADPAPTTASLLVVISGTEVQQSLDTVAGQVAAHGAAVVATLRGRATSRVPASAPEEAPPPRAEPGRPGRGAGGGPPLPVRGAPDRPSSVPPVARPASPPPPGGPTGAEPTRSPAGPPLPSRSGPPLPTRAPISSTARPVSAPPTQPDSPRSPASAGGGPPLPERRTR